MYNIIVSKKVHHSIKSFIDGYRNTFLDLFSDTGIFDENLIRSHYIDSSKKFQGEIFSLIEQTLQRETILGRKEICHNEFQISINVGNYRLLLHYTENIETKIRSLNDLKLHRK